MMMMGASSYSSGKGAMDSNGSIYISNLPPGTDEQMLAEYFGTIGLLKKDKRTGRPKIWLYRDKMTNEPKGDATVTYEDPHAALAAVEWFNKKDFHGTTIGVSIAESKSKDDHSYNSGNHDLVGDPSLASDFGGKAWQQEGDWPCPNTSSCSNVNFAFKWCVQPLWKSWRPAGGSGSGAGAGAGGRRGEENLSSTCASKSQFVMLTKANNYCLMDDGELSMSLAISRRNLGAKTQQAEPGQAVPGAGRAGWEVEELVTTGVSDRERSRDRERRERREAARIEIEMTGIGAEQKSRRQGKDRKRDYDYNREARI
ncbi:Transcription initiation factor TFIID subunit 15 [Camellia lanceoleosa]|uniref:Transcription initiation factor TFIID subunit 15 n=1 Tax=Camellia lanceoleosa TaxID=1840588 RepID=A0ACC0IAR4_9ERIC|nr:Transcription initiation factor TFIID subunit 15 [Camellia lanceoleosa]